METFDWHFYENEARSKGFQCICGIDEAGRGPLYGPVCAAAVILPKDCHIEGMNDSKKLSEKKRERLFTEILNRAVAYGIGYASSAEIDRINILNATYLAMMRAYDSMNIQADFVWIDGNKIPPAFPVKAKALVKGDTKCASIAAASILAKVSRDRLMRQHDTVHPEYGFAKHKGYPTKAHYESIRMHGVLPEHRKSFLKKRLTEPFMEKC